jgi:hypothetical protein
VATYPYLRPLPTPQNGQTGTFNLYPSYYQAQNAAWAYADFLSLQTTGTATPPSGGKGNIGTTVPGPTAAGVGPFNLVSTASTYTVNGVTIVGVASAGAPGLTYYCELTWGASGSVATNESATGTEFVINCAPGIVPKVYAANPAITNVGGLAVYLSLYPGTELLQGTTAGFGSGNAITAVYPLTNSQGVNKVATNVASNVVGLATSSSLTYFYVGGGGSFAGNEFAPFGVTNAQPPLTPDETYKAVVIRPQNTYFEMSLVQAYNSALQGTTAGITVDPTTGICVVDTSQSNKILTIVGLSQGAQIGATAQGGVNDIGARVQVAFTSGII